MGKEKEKEKKREKKRNLQAVKQNSNLAMKIVFEQYLAAVHQTPPQLHTGFLIRAKVNI